MKTWHERTRLALDALGAELDADEKSERELRLSLKKATLQLESTMLWWRRLWEWQSEHAGTISIADALPRPGETPIYVVKTCVLSWTTPAGTRDVVVGHAGTPAGAVERALDAFDVKRGVSE